MCPPHRRLRAAPGARHLVPALSAPALLLWDIDGTLLLGAAEAHRDALHAALEEVFEVADSAALQIETAGRTDPAIARELLERSNVERARIDAGLDALQAAWARRYVELCPPDLSHTVAPGVAAALAALAAREDVVLALLTGNLEPIARHKLARAGIGGFFAVDQGAFGSDDEERGRLPDVARRRAGEHPRERTVVIGDTPRDVACARAGGVRVVGVASGSYGLDALAPADAVVADAWALPHALDAVLG